jgi:hypothetical protein
MKNNYLASTLVFLLVASIQISVQAQDTLVQWTFPTELALADGGIIPANLSQAIETAGGTSEIQFKNGLTSKAAQATQWENGADAKKWKVEFETTGYKSIKLSSKITSGGQNPGPRDFKVQYKVDGDWTDVAESSFTTANDWTTGVLTDLLLPEACDNQALVKIRWIMTSDTATDGNLVGMEGISKIDDIYLVGDVLSGLDEFGFQNSIIVFPNPATDFIHIAIDGASQISLFDVTGKKLMEEVSEVPVNMNIMELNPGIYFVRIQDLKSGLTLSKKLIIN